MFSSRSPSTIASLVALVLVAAAIFAAVVHVHVGRGIGERTYDVAGIQDLRDELPSSGVGKTCAST